MKAPYRSFASDLKQTRDKPHTTIIQHDESIVIDAQPADSLAKRMTGILKLGILADCREADAKVLFCLAGHANWQSAECYPSFTTIALETGLQIRSAKGAVARLKSLGLVHVGKRQTPKGQTGNLYQISVPKHKAGASPCTGASGFTGASRCPKGVHGDGKQVAHGDAPERIKEHIRERSSATAAKIVSRKPRQSSLLPVDTQTIPESEPMQQTGISTELAAIGIDRDIIARADANRQADVLHRIRDACANDRQGQLKLGRWLLSRPDEPVDPAPTPRTPCEPGLPLTDAEKREGYARRRKVQEEFARRERAKYLASKC